MTVTAPKHIIVTIFLIGILLTINSCCTKMKCLGADDMNEIWFYNFTQENLDTIVIKRFYKNTNFSTAIDSSVTTFDNFQLGTDYQIVYLVEKLTVDYDYQVELVSSGQIFRLTDFVVKKERCNSGLACNDFFNSLSSYKVNGQQTNGGILSIRN